MKICVYAICKNESQFVDRWLKSMSEADQIIVMDTGSEDDTVERLKQGGAIVARREVSPWRFDVARNLSLELVPEDADICVCTDLDEVLRPGWRQALEAAWRPGHTRALYRYTWNFNPDGSEGYVFWTNKIHARHGYRWTHPVHEVLTWTRTDRPENQVTVEGLQLDHHADPKKSRASYLALLELSVQEDPTDDRNMHYLGREYMFRGQWDRCIDTLKRHLALPNATWADERCASMRFIARAYLQKGDEDSAKAWYLRAVAEAPHLREPYVELANLLHRRAEWDGVVYFTGCALKINQRPRTYICESDAWGSLPWDLRALGLFYTGRGEQSLRAAEEALRISPDNQRLQNNLRLIREALNQPSGAGDARM